MWIYIVKTLLQPFYVQNWTFFSDFEEVVKRHTVTVEEFIWLSDISSHHNVDNNTYKET
jgi:hypothetical protein